jgi:acetolactate synthase-1/2/3 large subunit
MKKVSDLVFEHLVEKHGISHCFFIPGGGAMHLNDSLGHTKGLTYICNHHEQACAIAQEGYYRASGKMCVTNVTTGPGGTNALTGVLGQWIDSIPALYISGQIKASTHMSCCPELKLRQLGDQESDVISLVKPITKYAVTIFDPLDIEYEIDKAMYIAQSGRPGPAWLDIPLNVQGAYVDETKLRHFNSSEIKDDIDHIKVDGQIDELIEKLKTAKAPILYVGNGVRLAKRTEQFIKFAETMQIPVVTAISGTDILWNDHPLYYGRPGICGDRIGNIMVQNSDLLIVMGTRLGIRQVGYAYDLFAPKAYKVMIDVDADEMEKPTLKIDLKIHVNLSEFIDKITTRISDVKTSGFNKWREWGKAIEKVIPTILEDNKSYPGYINSYVFSDELSKQLKSGDLVVTGNGTAYTCTFQSMKLNKGVRLFANEGCASMGYGLPASIGAYFSHGKEGRVVCVTGDGSIQMNLQELQTVVNYHIPLKIFELENDGYLAMKTTQSSFFDGRLTGADHTSGVICPDMKKIAAAYGIPFVRINEEKDLPATIEKVLNADGPMMCEIKMPTMQTLLPKAASFMDKDTGKMTSAPLEKMSPFISEELQKKCIFDPNK